jgi:hypothetical protein
VQFGSCLILGIFGYFGVFLFKNAGKFQLNSEVRDRYWERLITAIKHLFDP